MSWSVSIEDSQGHPIGRFLQGGACGNVAQGEVYDLSLDYTFNVSGAFRAVGLRFSECHGMTGKVAAPVLQEASDLLLADLAAFREHEPKNGWGTVEGGARFLAEVARVCRLHPDAVLTID